MRILIALMLVSILTQSCIKKEADVCIVNKVLIVYMGGDNNLSYDAKAKIDAIKVGWSKSSGSKIIIYKDLVNEAPELLEVFNEDGINKIKTVNIYNEENSASAAVLSRVIADVKNRYPVNKYGLMVFSHASGWLPEGIFASTRSVVEDNKREMELIDFASAIPDNTFEFIAFEMCFMAGIEVAYELKDKAKYILGSSAEIVSPGFEIVYSTYINDLASGNLEKFAENAFEYFANQNGYLNSSTLSIIKTSELNALSQWVKSNADMNKPIDIATIQHFDRNSNKYFFDFEDYFSRLVETDIQKNELKRLINNAVIWKESTKYFLVQPNPFEINNHSGLTTYIPQEKFVFLNNEYKKLNWSKNILK